MWGMAEVIQHYVNGHVATGRHAAECRCKIEVSSQQVRRGGALAGYLSPHTLPPSRYHQQWHCFRHRKARGQVGWGCCRHHSVDHRCPQCGTGPRPRTQCHRTGLGRRVRGYCMPFWLSLHHMGWLPGWKTFAPFSLPLRKLLLVTCSSAVRVHARTLVWVGP